MDIDEKAIAAYLAEYGKKLADEIGHNGTWSVKITCGYDGVRPHVEIYMAEMDGCFFRADTLEKCASLIRAVPFAAEKVRAEKLKKLRRTLKETTAQIEALGETVEEPAAHE